MIEYPIVKCPEALMSISISLPPKPPEPKYPIPLRPPEFKKSPEPDVKPFISHEQSKESHIGVRLVLALSFGYTILFGGILSIVFLLDQKWLLWIFPLLGIILAQEYFKERKQARESREYVEATRISRLKDFDYRMKENERELKFYDINMGHYYKLVEEYDRRIIEYQEKIKLLETPSYIVDYRKSLYEHFKMRIRKPEYKQNQFFSGVAESILVEKLNYFFNGVVDDNDGVKIHLSLTIDKESGKEYYPDIILQHGHLLIDIEIDEPYVGSTGDPIHFIGYDDKLDEILLKNNWCIIRFAEEQVVRDTDTCCYFIANFIFEMTGNDRYLKLFKETYYLNRVQRWTKDEAIRWAYTKKRNDYLPAKLISVLHLESNLTPKLLSD